MGIGDERVDQVHLGAKHGLPVQHFSDVGSMPARGSCPPRGDPVHSTFYSSAPSMKNKLF